MRAKIEMHIGAMARDKDSQIVASSGSTVKSVLSAMQAMKRSAAFIVDETGMLRAKMTDDELSKAKPDLRLDTLSALEQGNSTSFVAVDATAVECFQLMKKNNVDILPVVDRNKILHGFIELSDLHKHLSPERIYPSSLDGNDIDKNIERHIARYRFASQFISGSDVVLDAGCGSGYGSAILAEKASSVIGVDISEKAISYAQSTYSSHNIEFVCKDLCVLSFQSQHLNAVVCLETIEHLPNDLYKDCMHSMRVWLKRGGIMIASSPMLRYIDSKPFITNPHHVNEMPREELIKSFTEIFPDFVIQYFHQKQNSFLPLLDETTGFCIIVARKK